MHHQACHELDPSFRVQKPFVVQKSDYRREFISAMQEADIFFNGEIIPDGTIHRFHTGKKEQKDGWYVFYGMAGAFGDWRQDIHEKWSLRQTGNTDLDQEHISQQIEKARFVANLEHDRKQQEISNLADELWNSYSVSGESSYLNHKQVKAFGIRFGKDSLIVPVRDISGKLWSLQYIDSSGHKRFLKGGKKKGCFHTIGTLEDGKPVLVCEGYATGASLHMATGHTVVIAFDAGNLDSVVSEIKKSCPGCAITVAGDDDYGSPHNVGRTKATEVAQKHGCSVIFPQFKDLATRPTDFNDLHILEGIEAVKTQLNQRELSPEWPTPQPSHAIRKELSPVIPLPSALIPEPYRKWLEDITERMQCPLDYVAVGALIVTSSIIGAGCSIRPKRLDSWTVIPNLWGGVVGAPSTLKSPALKEIMRPLEALERESFETYENDQHNYLIESEAYKATKEVIKKEMTKAAITSDTLGMMAAKEKLRHLREPEFSSCKRYSTNDTTIEKMHELLSYNSRGLLLFRDELMGLLTHWDKGGHESDRAFYLEAWNGYGSRITDRIGRGTIQTKNLCISILGSTQPTKLFSYFQKTLTGIENDGLLQRFQLLVYPDEIRDWKLVDRKPDEYAKEKAFQIMKKLAHTDFTQMGAQSDEKTEIPYFHFDENAQDLFYEWLKDLEDRLRKNQDDPILIEHLTKYRKLMPSLALIFHLIELANGKAPGSITVECAHRAAGWCDYLAAHAKRIYEMSVHPHHQAARNLIRKIQDGELKNGFDIREVYRKQWSFLKSRAEVEPACEILIENGWLQEATLPDGNKSRGYYLINPQIRETCK